jgi:hypothetical protein
MNIYFNYSISHIHPLFNVSKKSNLLINNKCDRREYHFLLKTIFHDFFFALQGSLLQQEFNRTAS